MSCGARIPYDFRMRLPASAVAKFAISALLPAALAQAQELPSAKLEQIKGTNVRMVRPAGFEVAERFPGFMDQSRLASVMVNLLPTEPAKILEGLTDENLASRGMKVLARSSNPEGAASKGLLLHLAQSQAGIDFRKWMFVFDGDGKTVMVVATYRTQDRDSLEDPLRASVLGALYDAAATVDPEAALPFRVGSSIRFRHRDVLGRVLFLSERDFHNKPRRPDESIFCVGPSLGKPVSPDARRSAFDRRLKQTATMRDLNPGEVTKVKLDGLQGFECVATGTRTDGKAKVVLYHVMLFDEVGYYLIQGHTVPGNRERDLAEFKRLARTFRRVEADSKAQGDNE